MPIIQCPIEGCEYETPDVEPVIAAALITTHVTSHRMSSGSTQTPRVERVKRLNVSSAGTTEDWQYFKSRWNDYVKATRLEGTDKIVQLLECCDDQLRKDLTRNAGGTLTKMTENEVLAAMRKLAIREENTTVARVTLHNMRQDRDEPIRAYGARLRGQASVSKFTQQCTGCEANVDYTEAIIKDVLCRGLENTEIQMDLLGDKNQDMTMEQVLRFVKAKEAGKRSASRLLLPQATDAMTGSSYRRQKKPQPKARHQRIKIAARTVGTKGRGRSPSTRTRRIECPAFGTKCNLCDKNNHFEKMCRSKHDTRSAKNTKQDDAIFDTLCEITSTDSTKSTTLDHHVFDEHTKEWLRKQSKPQPYIRLQMSIWREDYNHFGFPLRIPQVKSFVNAMADTGCQSCLAGLKVVKCMEQTTTTYASWVPPY